MGGVLRPEQPRAPDRCRHDVAVVAVDVRVRHAGVPGHGRGQARRRLLLARRAPVRRPPPARRPRLDDAVKTLTDDDWQFRSKGLGPKGYLEMDEYDGKPNHRTRKH